MKCLQPLIRQRADPFIRRHDDGFYYFTASVPTYDRIELRRAPTIAGLATAATVDVWRKPDEGPLCELIWAPELHRLKNAWYIYFAAAPSRAIKDGLFQHRIYVISSDSANPLMGEWKLTGRVETGIESFCLDATTFSLGGNAYFVWAQKDPSIPGNSNLYIARMDGPSRLATAPARLSQPQYDWETRGFSVNEGPSVLVRHGRVFITYSASATDENYCLGLIHAREDADPLDPRSWTKSPQPVFKTCFDHGVYGPGHNSFTVSEDGVTDLLVFHARTYTHIVGDPLWDPNRHTYVKSLSWDNQGLPLLGCPCGMQCGLE